MDEPEGWNAYRSFLAVLRTGSLSAAARSLGLTQPTTGRHVEALERGLGAALFTRSVRGLQPTDMAAAIRQHAETMEAAVAAARRVSSSPADALSGVVRITTSEIVGGLVLPQILTDLRKAHPGLVFELSASNQTEDLMRRDADIAVRMVKPAQGALLSAAIGRVDIGLFGHRDYLTAAGTPRSVAALNDHAIIGFDRVTPFIDAAASVLKLDRAMFALRTDSDLAATAMLRAGFGLGVCQVPLARRWPDLKRVLARDIGFPLDIWVVMHEDLKRVRRMRLVFDALTAAMRRYVKGSGGKSA